MSAPNTNGAAVLEELKKQLNGGIVTLDLLKRATAALERHVKRDAARVSGFTRRTIPPHQADVERQAVAEKWAYVNGTGVGSDSPGNAGYVKMTREKKVAWIAKRLQLPVRRVRGYLTEIAELGPYVRVAENRETLTIVGQICEACQVAGDACLEHASARRIFNAALPDVQKKPRLSERQARLRHTRNWLSGWGK
jgi:hypothetical protein